ncbi:MAG: acyl-CoA/acyl-ACP dehydrogenase [Streptosporangiaceae bacterium]|nr:acyl-CoA/acyl-ACP dehydrogenase [Streptosporangiaceae bacterium]MBV9855414.1 acyl-CoA/acyl-ACP dehydrogenase [Streptosporangiaceae bacterium]
MDFAFSPEQEELRRTVRQFLDKTSPEAEVRRLMATERGYDPDSWRRMAGELGLLGLAIPEGYGGAGAGFAELGIVAQEMGRALFCGPFLGTAVLAASALLESGDDAARRGWLPAIAAGELIATLALPGTLPGGTGWEVTARPGPGDDWILDGIAQFVLDGHISDLILVPAAAASGTSLFAVSGAAPGLARGLLPAFDATRKYARLRFSATPAAPVGSAGGAAGVLARVFDLACVALACEQVGVAERALDMARDYALLRTQFGRAIGSFQAVKHKLADVLLEVEAARSAAWYGLWAADCRPAELPVVASIAKATCSAAAYLATTENIHLHGGIGYTWEHPAHLYFRRATTSRMWLGDPAGHHERLLSRLGY